MDALTFDKENRERIQAVENSFGPAVGPLSKPGRVLLGQGRLMKQGRRKPQPKVFFLFNDVLVYGSIILNGHWYKKQKIISLEDIQLEDVDDSEGSGTKWLVRTPRKSFFVSANSFEEKRDWMKHIEDCRSNLLQGAGGRPKSDLAVTWIPDQAAYKCMRCLKKFTAMKRRHHCRKCGFLVCNACSKQRAVIGHIHPTKLLRVCRLCHGRNKEDEMSRLRGDSTGKNSSEEDCEVASSDEEEGEEMMQSQGDSTWLDSRNGTWGQTATYAYPRPMHLRPQYHFCWRWYPPGTLWAEHPGADTAQSRSLLQLTSSQPGTEAQTGPPQVGASVLADSSQVSQVSCFQHKPTTVSAPG